MSREYRLVIANRPMDCSCPCPLAHGGAYAPAVACVGTIPTGGQYGVLVLDGQAVAERCLPCARATGWRTTA